MKKIILFLVLIQIWSFSNCADKKIENWKIKVRGAIFSTPVVHGNTLYIGTEEGNFYWIDASTGSITHEVKVSGPIRSNALVLGQNVFVESCGQLYCFNTETAQEKYKVSPVGENLDMADYWDYYHNSPVEYEGLVYYAGNLGIIYIVDPEKGSVVKTIKTVEGAPIRSALTINNEVLYFGDNNGIIYGYDLKKEAFSLIHKTFEKRPYSTYGFITGGPVVYNDKVFFGNRHETFTALNLNNLSIAWSRVDDIGSWWPATPVIVNDKVIIGGSDNFLLSALRLDSGKTIWNYKTDYNIFCKPLVISSNTLIVGTGDSYLNRKGNGSVFSINANDGIIINKYKPDGNVFSSPVKFDNSILICTTTGNICSINEEFFTNPQSQKVEIEGDFEMSCFNDCSSIVEKQLFINNYGSKVVSLSYSINTDGSFADSLIKFKGEKEWLYPIGKRSLFFQFNRGDLKPGIYKGEVTFILNDGKEAIVKPFVINVQGSSDKNESAFEVLDYSPDIKDGSVKYKLRVNRKSQVVGLLNPVGSDSVVAFISPANFKWGIYRAEKDIFSLDLNNIKPGRYKLVFKSKEHKVEFDYYKE